VIDRSSFDRIVQAGGFISARCRVRPEEIDPDSQARCRLAMEAAACIGCGACAAACPNGSAMLFTSAKVSHLAIPATGHPERESRAFENGFA